MATGKKNFIFTYFCMSTWSPSSPELSEICSFIHRWAFQERLVKSGLLHFSELELSRECHTKSSSETFPRCFSITLQESGLKDEAAKFTERGGLVIELHSTKGRDKSVTVSGVTKLYSKEDYVLCLSRLWRKYPEDGTCWRLQSSSASQLVAVPYRALLQSLGISEGSAGMLRISYDLLSTPILRTFKVLYIMLNRMTKRLPSDRHKRIEGIF
ncbi:hypothetical protein B0O99DRAFT_592830 [Bisporella sp. PMI_857]|nr:hypothetical protein B0O99DRAFT_592830 [Bisporella sp. PMI_857]